MSQEIELYNRINDPVGAIEKLGTIFAKSAMFGCDRPEQGMVLAWTCIAERKTPLEIKRRYHLQNGDLSVRADAMLADFRAIAKGKHKIIARTSERAAIELTLDGDTQLFEFTWEQAKLEPFVYGKEKQIKKNYATPRARMQMLWARVISDGVRTMAPEIVSGTYTPEELDDSSEVQTKPLLPTKDTATAEPKPAKVTEVRTVEPSERPRTEETQSAEPAPAPAPDKPAVSHWEDFKNPKHLHPEAANALAEVLTSIGGPDGYNKAMEWLGGRGWLQPHEGPTKWFLHELSPQRAQKLYEKPEKFMRDIGAV